ncbi:MAG: ATP-binding cassette domain-containing protein [Rikenellaceae bacterium]|nr:ATP-binding cassette domain-containing protein [Rikenellaceae bacterium]
MKSLLRIIPQKFRAATVGVIFTALVRALLNFAGLAVLLPVLIMVLDSQRIHSNRLLVTLYNWGGFSSDQQFIVATCVAVIAFIAIKQGANLLLQRFQRQYTINLYKYFSIKVFRNYHDRGLAFLKRQNTALLSRNVNFICYNIVMGVIAPMISITSEILLLGLLLGALMWYNWQMALLAVAAFIPLSWIYIVILRGKLRQYGQIENEARRQQARAVIETFRGYTDIEVNNAFATMQNRFEQSLDTIAQIKRRTDIIGAVPSIITEMSVALAMVVLILFSTATSRPDTSILFGIFAVAAIRILPSVRSIMAQWWQIRYNYYCVDIVSEGLDDADNILHNEAIERINFNSAIEVRNMSFRFDDADKGQWTLRNLNLTIRKGEKVGIQGTSGAGKTTLFNLLLGFLSPTEGEILIDGHPLDNKIRRSWQTSIGYVSQHVYIEDSTLAGNIALGIDPDKIDRERLQDAIRRARLEELINQLSQGADTPIGECGSRLSGGQRQRIGIARALYKQADILFFDEATSSLDNRTEQEINNAIEQLSREQNTLTIVVIAHRSSSLEYCDRIIEI